MPQDKFIQAFSTPIMQRQYDNNDKINKDLCESVLKLEKTQETSDYKRAHQGGFYTDGDFLDSGLPGTSELKKIILDISKEYIDKSIKNESGENCDPANFVRSIRMWGWAAITRERDYQTPHVHAGATFSVVYYAKIPKGKPEPQGCLDFITPIDLKEMTFIKGASKTFCRISPQEGTVAVFPAYLKHYFHPFFDGGERIMIATNVKVD